jgi:hypothetical protein
LSGCGQASDPAPTVTRKPDLQQLAQHARRPEVTTEKIARDIVGKQVAVAEQNGDGAVKEWTFEAGDFRQINIQETYITNTGVALIIFMATRNTVKPGAAPHHVAGKIELQYKWSAGQWVLATLKNLTFRYTVANPT